MLSIRKYSLMGRLPTDTLIMSSRLNMPDTEPTDGPRWNKDLERTFVTPRPDALVTPYMIEGTHMGNFTIKRLIGAGGMGRVYEAQQDSPRRIVAIKLMGKGVVSASSLKRFEFEAQILARLKHAGIAQIYEAGNYDDGSGSVPWFAMEYIGNAKPITEYARDLKLGTRQRLHLFRQACEAIAHGHQRGVIHRDLKPGNILVDGSGHVKVIDFGVARTTDSDMAVATMQTDVGQLIGTLQYMSPEQFDADPHDLDIRSDVYALGVVLYELLTDQLPYDLRKKPIHEAARIVREQEPARMSTLVRTLRGDLEVIHSKAMAKDRTQRYGSANELAQDIQHCLQGEPITARAPGVVETLRRFATRYRAITAGILSAFAMLAILVVVLSLMYLDGQRKNVELQKANTIAQANLIEANAQRDAAALAQTEKQKAVAQSDAALNQLDPEKYVSAVRRGTAALANNRVDIIQQELRAIRDLRIDNLDKRFEIRLLAAALSSELLVLAAHEKQVNALAVSPDGRTLASASADGTIRLWNAQTGVRIMELKGHTLPVNTLAFSPDGRTLASGSDDTTIRLWDARANPPLQLGECKGHTAPVRGLAFAPDGRTLASCSADRTVKLWDTLAHTCTNTLNGHEKAVRAVAFNFDGSLLASAGSDKTTRLWNPTTGAALRTLADHTDALPCLAFSSDGQALADGATDGSLSLWRVANGLLMARTPLQAPINSLAFSPNTIPNAAAVLAVATTKGIVRIDPFNGNLLSPSGDSSIDSTSVVFAPDGGTFVSGCADGKVRVWDVDIASASEKLRVGNAPLTALAFAPASLMLAVGTGDGVIQLWDTTISKPLATLQSSGEPVQALRFTPDGRVLASGSRDGALKVWNATTGELQRTLQPNGAALYALAISLDGRTLATAGDDHAVQLWDMATGKSFAQLRGHNASVYALAFTPDSNTLASASADGSVRVWDIPNRRERGMIPSDVTGTNGHSAAVRALAFSADGRTLVTGSFDRSARLWDVTTLKQRAVMQGHQSEVESLAFDPAGRTVASGSRDGTVRLWDAASGKEFTVLTPQIGGVQSLAFTDSGEVLACGGASGGMHIMRAESIAAFVTPRNALRSAIERQTPHVRRWFENGGVANAQKEFEGAQANLSPIDRQASRDALLLLAPAGVKPAAK